MPERKTLNEDLFYRGSSANLPRLHTCKNKVPFWDFSQFAVTDLKWCLVRRYFNPLFPASDLKWGLVTGIIIINNIYCLWSCDNSCRLNLPWETVKEKKEYCRNSQITRWYNCLEKLKKNGKNRKLFKRTLHGKVGEAEKKRDNENWREAWVKCSENYEETWTR